MSSSAPIAPDAPTSGVAGPAPAPAGRCAPGAHTLSAYGERVYPETGNGGYTSVHTDVDLRYSAAANVFLPGNHVVLTEHATQCLSSFTLDFQPTSSVNPKAAPEMSVASVTVGGAPARFRFVQPTYPGDPHGEEDPDPRAHEASQVVPVGGPQHDPLPPACSPELPSEGLPPESEDASQCPATKLLITPASAIPASARFVVDVSYTGRPGIHDDADGEEEGWFRAPDGSLVATEPIGAEVWMPLNDYPTAKPTYSFHETVEVGKVAVANGILTGVTHNPPESDYPEGSLTWNWESDAPVANYLVQSSIGDYSLSSHVGGEGITYYEAQDELIPPAQQAHNAAIMARQEEITAYESRFNGPFPFLGDGAIVGTPSVAFQEEMQGMISFNEGVVQLPILWHENMHQWWGDHVTEGSYEMTFFKEGLAEWMESYVFPAHGLQGAQFEQSLIEKFDKRYASRGSFWTIAPSHPYAYTLFDYAATYERPAAAYEALRRILGASTFAAVLAEVQRDYGGSSITEPQWEAAFQQALPVQSAACHARLAQFFIEWFDTAYAPGGGAQKPQITGPGLDGAEFYARSSGCSRSAVAAARDPVRAGARAHAAAAAPRLIAGFSADTPALVAHAAAAGITSDILYDGPPAAGSRLASALAGAHMNVIDGRLSSELFYWECHRTHTVAPPPKGERNWYCARDEEPGVDSQTVVLATIREWLREDAADPLVTGYWVLDDWPEWDGGSGRGLLVKVRQAIEQATPQYPAICGFGGAILEAGESGGFDRATAANYSNEGCSMVGLYNYAEFQRKPSNGDAFDWSMTTLLQEETGDLAARGWSLQSAPMLGIGQAWSGPIGHEYSPGLSASQMLAQARAFCAAGATSIGWYAWDDSGFGHGTRTPNNSAAIRQGIEEGISACGG